MLYEVITGLGAAEQLRLVAGRDADVEEQGVLGQQLQHPRLVQLAEAAAHVVHEVV